jgi:hypothetical protein
MKGRDPLVLERMVPKHNFCADDGHDELAGSKKTKT